MSHEHGTTEHKMQQVIKTVGAVQYRVVELSPKDTDVSAFMVLLQQALKMDPELSLEYQARMEKN